MEIKNKSNRIPKDQLRVLGLIDGRATLKALTEHSRIAEAELRKILAALSDGGFIKEFGGSAFSADASGAAAGRAAPAGSEVDDLDFTQSLGPSQPLKPGQPETADKERRQRDLAEQKSAEAGAKAKAEAEQRAKADAERNAAEQRLREKLEAEDRAKADAQRKAAEQRLRDRLEAEDRAKAEAEREALEESQRQAKLAADAARVEAERRVKEEQAKLEA